MIPRKRTGRVAISALGRLTEKPKRKRNGFDLQPLAIGGMRLNQLVDIVVSVDCAHADGDQQMRQIEHLHYRAIGVRKGFDANALVR